MQRPQFVFLSETKLLSMQMNVVRNKLNFRSCFAMNNSEKGDGLAMFSNYLRANKILQ